MAAADGTGVVALYGGAAGATRFALERFPTDIRTQGAWAATHDLRGAAGTRAWR